jgi:hypothetical protein
MFMERLSSTEIGATDAAPKGRRILAKNPLHKKYAAQHATPVSAIRT